MCVRVCVFSYVHAGVRVPTYPDSFLELHKELNSHQNDSGSVCCLGVQKLFIAPKRNTDVLLTSADDLT